MGSKIALKEIKALIDANDFTNAALRASDLVKKDPKNYTGLIFQGFANDKLDQYEQAEKAYSAALTLKPTDPQALKGQITLYEKHGATYLDQYHDTVAQLANLYAEVDDRGQCQSVIDKYEIFARKYGSKDQYRHALELLLPTSSLYGVLEGRVPHPSHTYKRILESAEAEEKEWVNQQIGERRTRLGAKRDEITQQVKFEAVQKFAVEDKIQAVIDWIRDDDERRVLEDKRLLRAFDDLLVLPSQYKAAQRDKVLEMANGTVIIKNPFQPAWDIALNWVDAESLSDWDVTIFREYIGYFPDAGLSKVLRGFLDSDVSPFPHIEEEISAEEDGGAATKMTEADRLILMVEGLDDSSDALLAHRIMAEMYLALEEYESAVSVARKAQKLHLNATQTFSLVLQDSIDAVNITLANALITYQSPRHHPEAKALFAEVLTRKPTMTAPLLGTGLVLEEDEDYGEAVKFLERAAERDSTNLQIRLELAWCRALHQDLAEGLTELEEIFAQINSEKKPDLAMKSEVQYRIAYCRWHLDTSTAARKDKNGPYRYLIGSLKANPEYAPAYTLLGIYFQDYGKSKPRARVALQKAFELSTSELVAAERLAKAFADNAEWDLVELVAQRVVDSGKAKPAPGSKKKSLSWPYAALGVVQMNKQQYAQAVVSLQSALRIEPTDYHSWVSLGESYHNMGRYRSAARCFEKAEGLDHGLPLEQTWFAKYMLANVLRELGSFDEAVVEYRAVLEVVKDEFGVQMALLQTFTESAQAKLEIGMFGEATNLALEALRRSVQILKCHSSAFNLWKAVGDACSVFARAQTSAMKLDIRLLTDLLQQDRTSEEVQILSDVDQVTVAEIEQRSSVLVAVPETERSVLEISDYSLLSAIVAHKRAIHASISDQHAQAVAWYNLGWAEHQAALLPGPSLLTKGKNGKRFVKAAVRCFKRAIELEASNAEFWNALGVVTMTLHPRLSQHSFVRSLHLNENSARVWTNIGTLYLLNNDIQLANSAFTRAQSADPQYAHAWLGQGLVATLLGNIAEARGLFLNAFENASSTSTATQRHFAVSAFDHLLKDPGKSVELTNLLQPLFALRQLHAQAPADRVFNHLSSLLCERVGDFGESTETLEEICSLLEAEYEQSESRDLLAKFAQAKADLARSRLAHGQFDEAITHATTALDLSAEDDLGPAYTDSRRKWRLSAHITSGLAHNRLGNKTQSIKLLQAALAESHAPDLVCTLSQVLWTHDHQSSRDLAREHLFETVEKHPTHVGAATCLAVIGLLDDDRDILDAVEDDLTAMRVSDKLSIHEKTQVTRVLAEIIACAPAATEEDSDLLALADATTGIMLSPFQPQGWSALANVTDSPYPAQMALSNAKRQVSPTGTLNADGLAMAYAGTGTRADALQAIVIAPWAVEGWQTLAPTT